VFTSTYGCCHDAFVSSSLKSCMTAISILLEGFFLPPPMTPSPPSGISRNSANRSCHWPEFFSLTCVCLPHPACSNAWIMHLVQCHAEKIACYPFTISRPSVPNRYACSVTRYRSRSIANKRRIINHLNITINYRNPFETERYGDPIMSETTWCNYKFMCMSAFCLC